MSAIQLVVGVAGTPSATDALIKGWLEALGHTVTYVDDDTAENTTGIDGIVIGDSCATGSLGTKYEAVALPIVTHEGFYVDTLRMSSAEGAVAESLTQFVIVDATHPFVNGPYGAFSGTWTWATAAAAAVYIDDATVDFGADVRQVAESPTSSTRKVMFSYEAGDDMATGTAPHRRGYFSLRDASGTLLNADGINAVKNAYAWAFGAALDGRRYRRLVGPVQLGTSPVDLYVAPTAARAVIRRVLCNNPSGSPVAFTMSIGADAAGTRIYDAQSIPAGGAIDDNGDDTLEAGERIQAYAGTGSALVLLIDGYEESL